MQKVIEQLCVHTTCVFQ